jgi:HPr kinase/phosphorylase
MTFGEARERVHANAFVIGEVGILLRGPSGSGKSALTLELLTRARERGDFAALIADDRVELVASNGRLVARPHPAIAGMMEVRGVGVVRAPFEPAGLIRAVIDLVDAAGPFPDRFPDANARMTTLCGLSLPLMILRAGDAFSVVRIHAFIHELTAI